MPRRIDPSSRASRLLSLLMSTPGRSWETKDLAAAIDVPTSLAAQTLTGSTRSAAGGSRWRHVRRVCRGVWVYDEQPQMEPVTAWEPVAEDGDAVVLRGPDGRLWAARRL